MSDSYEKPRWARDAAAHSRAHSYLERAPKVDLHVHLEGAVRPARLLQILRRNGVHSDLRSEADVAFLYKHDSLQEFLDHYRFVVTALSDVQDVHDIALDLFRELRMLRVVYAEVIFSAGIFVRMGMPWDELLSAVTEAETMARKEANVEKARPYGLVIDLVRNFGAKFAVQQVEALEKLRPERVVGIHLGGDEAGFPCRDFGTAFGLAAEINLGRAAHAGEGAGAESVREAVEVLGVQRVGHGVRCLEDAAVVDLLLERQVTLEVCLSSNRATGLVSSITEHPLPKLLDAGLAITLGSDDPSYFDTDILREHLLAHDELGISLEVLNACADAGIHSAFLDADARQELQAEVVAERRSIA